MHTDREAHTRTRTHTHMCTARKDMLSGESGKVIKALTKAEQDKRFEAWTSNTAYLFKLTARVIKREMTKGRQPQAHITLLYKHTNTRAKPMCTHAHERMHACTHAHTHIHTHALAHAHTHVCIPTHPSHPPQIWKTSTHSGPVGPIGEAGLPRPG